MKKLLIGLLIVSFVLIGCAGLWLGRGWSVDSLLEKSRTLAPNEAGWRILSIPSKEYPEMEYLFFTRGKDWGLGIIEQGPTGGSIMLIHRESGYIYLEMGFPQLKSDEEGAQMLKGFWDTGKYDMVFERMGPFKKKVFNTTAM